MSYFPISSNFQSNLIHEKIKLSLNCLSNNYVIRYRIESARLRKFHVVAEKEVELCSVHCYFDTVEGLSTFMY